MADLAIANSIRVAPTGLELAACRVDRRGNGPLGVPSKQDDPPANRLAANIGDPLPLSEAGLSASHRQKDIVGSVLLLLQRRRPAAIPRLVVPIIVDAIDGGPGWPVAHVGKEIPEVQPAVTDANASATVSGVLGVVRIEAAPLHVHPDDVGAPSGTALRTPMFCVARGCGLANQAPAGLCMPAHQAMSQHRRSLPACAFAEPRAGISLFFSKANHGQPPECLADEVIGFWHAEEYAVFPLRRR